MKKIGVISVFIFLTGLFSGLFFSTDLSPENLSHLSSLLIYGISSSSDFFKSFMQSMVSNLTLALLMLPALFTKLLCPLPMALLFYKSFSLGFCSGLVQMASPDNALLVSLLKFFPQNVFFIPAFIILSAAVFSFSVSEAARKNRPFREKKGLKNACILSSFLLLTGCITEALCRLIAL